jgi:hypothetical protein
MRILCWREMGREVGMESSREAAQEGVSLRAWMLIFTAQSGGLRRVQTLTWTAVSFCMCGRAQCAPTTAGACIHAFCMQERERARERERERARERERQTERESLLGTILHKEWQAGGGGGGREGGRGGGGERERVDYERYSITRGPGRLCLSAIMHSRAHTLTHTQIHLPST